MRKLLSLTVVLTFCILTLPFSVLAQPGANQPDLLECGSHGDAEAICGTRAPEDFELTPDGKFLIIANFGQGKDAALDFFELSTQQFSEIPLYSEPLANWGEASCTESIGAAVSPHGLSLSQRASGEWQFYVVNHNVRESMEMYELLPEGNSWKLVWHGCMLASEPYNDVSTRPDGSFIATRPQAIMAAGDNLFGGQVTGNVGVWNVKDGETVLPGTEYGYPNGVLVSNDGKFAYISAWTTSSFHVYSLDSKQEIAAFDLNFMPDNLTWTPEGKILAAGIKGVTGNCPIDSDDPCIQGFEVTEFDPQAMSMTTIFDSQGRALINGTSVAFEVKGDVFVGSFQGTRMVKFAR